MENVSEDNVQDLEFATNHSRTRAVGGTAWEFLSGSSYVIRRLICVARWVVPREILALYYCTWATWVPPTTQDLTWRTHAEYRVMLEQAQDHVA